LGGGNEDKGYHYLSQTALGKLEESSNQNYTVTVMHHGPEWFESSTKEQLYTSLARFTDLLFVGHEHFAKNEVKQLNGESLDESSGIALYGTSSERGFNTLVLDTEAHTLVGKKFVFNGTIFKPELVINDRSVVFSSNSCFKFTPNFQSFLVSDEGIRRGESFSDYFVFPSLEATNVESDIKEATINKESRFLEVLTKKRKISIEGGTKSGKTILAKYLTQKLSTDYVVLLLNEDNFLAKTTKNVIKDALLNEYGKDADLDAYLQLPVDKRILLVDGVDKISKRKWEEFIADNDGLFSAIVTFSDTNWTLNIRKQAVDELTDNAFFNLRICPFYYQKRGELILKICGKYALDNPSIDIEEKSRCINDDITNQIRYFQLTPDFIHQFVDYDLRFSQIRSQNDTNAFSKVFIANITYKINGQVKVESDVDEIMVALDFVAYYIHFEKKNQVITLQEFEEAVNEYKSVYDNENLNTRYVFDVALASNILRSDSSSFNVEFSDRNVLAYFVAQHLNRSLHRGEKEEELQEVLNNICFGINGDILLFLTYITSDTRILNPILDSAVAHMNEWEELDLDLCNIDYLKTFGKPVLPDAPTKNERQQVAKKKNDIEKKIYKESKKESEDLYSYDESKVDLYQNKIIKGIAYLQLMAKILPNFRHILKKNEKEAIICKLYTYPNKLLFFMLKDIDDNLDGAIEEILKKEPKTSKGLLITADMFKRELQHQSMAYILSIYDFVAMTAATPKTISDLEKFDFNAKTNYQIQNLLMQENIANFGTFAKRAESLFDKTDLNIAKQMVALIVRKYFIYHNVDTHGEAAKIVDKFFEGQRKDIQIQQARNMIIKK
jgi:hypothetical protein